MRTTRWALLIGVNGYKPAIGQLRYSVLDATQVEQALNSRRDGFESTESILLSDTQRNELKPTKVNIIENVSHVCNAADSKDTILIYFSGHGTIDEQGECYFLPMDASPISIEQTAIPWSWFRDKLDQCHAKNKIFIVDACHSGAGKDAAEAVRKSFQVIEGIERGTTEGFVSLCSCSGGQLSYELPDLEQSIFSYYLVKGILGAADPLRRDIIEIGSLYTFIRDRTLRHARQIGVEQEPYLVSKIRAPLDTFTICAASLDRPINRVLILTEDPFLGHLMEKGIQMSALARDATWIDDLRLVMEDIVKKFEYDAVYVDVRKEWKQKKEVVLTIRRRYPIVPFVLIGSRSSFLDSLDENETGIYSQYFFFDVNTPLVSVPAVVADTLGQVEWDIRTRFGEKIDFDR